MSGTSGIAGIPGQDIKIPDIGGKDFSGYSNYIKNRKILKELEDEKEKEKLKEKEKKEKLREKKKREKESSKEDMDGMSDNGGVFDFLKCILHLDPRSRHTIDDVKRLPLFQSLPSSTSSTTSTSTSFKAPLTPQVILLSFCFINFYLCSCLYSYHIFITTIYFYFIFL
jgi:hypothetical protein